MATVLMKNGTETYEQLVLTIMRRLPPYRLLELVDFARFIAHEAREDYQAGRTTEIIITDQGELAPA